MCINLQVTFFSLVNIKDVMRAIVPWNVSSMTSRIAQSAPWMYAATPLTKSLVTLKAFLPITTGSTKLTSVAPEKDSTHSKTSRLEWDYFDTVQFSLTLHLRL